MIYTVHGYYGKINSRKQQAKIEATVFAANAELAQSLVERLFDRYPANLDYFNVTSGTNKTLGEIYQERPELQGISPDCGYIYNLFFHKDCIYKYFK